METPKRVAYAQLARAVDEYVSDTILVKTKAGNSLPSIAAYLGLEQETIMHMGVTETDGTYTGKNQSRLPKEARDARDAIIVELFDKGMKRADIMRKMELSPSLVGAVVNRHLETKGKKR